MPISTYQLTTSIRREGLVETLPRKLPVELAERPRLVVLEEDGQEDGVVGGRRFGADGRRRTCLRMRRWLGKHENDHGESRTCRAARLQCFDHFDLLSSLN